ncbi:MAG: peptide chain release factor 1 [Candidatus Nealsonbacteria bacterium CG08_land_8_20_14_0_20_43_11]|uniref:Peptide chain release factor 1 n=1 Tax=Candidatus Nealsonbacteria bacterium CG08_land_8_20_14_0_20_43_11 TaxID=1974706 RepID=A0A2M6T1C5_9BACT|nr:MAG: peptide chain release factor 1 [Candidatus Nealsonbacteria bacterium CG08_land_8_20_14_0_20_43_11]
MSPVNIEEIKKESESVISQLGDPELISDPKKLEELSRRKEDLEKILDKEKGISELKIRLEENQEIIKAQEDPELVSLAQVETSQLEKKIKVLEKEIENLIEDEESAKKQAVIMEIRAGTGGDEAALFCGDLFRTYSRYADRCGWQMKVLDSNPTEIGGFKEIIFELSPTGRREEKNDIWALMKYEAGVHRVQRIPETEKSGRIHTSTISVAVLLKPKLTETKIRSDDLKIEFFRASGPGGQNVNRRETAVRIIHLPSGLIVTSQTERSQLDNRQNAMTILAARLMEKQQQEAEESLSDKRKTQIGWAKRAEKIRTYNFPQDRITDHRIKKSWHNLEEILNGDLERIINDLKNSEMSE